MEEVTGGRPPLLNDSDDNTDGDSPLFLSLLLRTLLPPPKLAPKPPFEEERTPGPPPLDCIRPALPPREDDAAIGLVPAGRSGGAPE